MITCIRGGTIVFEGSAKEANLWIENERVLSIGDGPGRTDRTIDAVGCLVLPGGIDPHVHMGFTVGPYTSSDDFISGTRAAAFGGVTTILDFAVPDGDESSSAALQRRIDEASGPSAVDFGIHAVVSRVEEDVASDIRRCITLGAPDFKTFTTYDDLRLAWDDLERLMMAVRERGGLVMVHAESDEGIRLRRARLVRDGRLSAESHLQSRPAEVESDAIHAVLDLQTRTGCPVHFAHLSAAMSVDLVAEARSRGRDVSAETCPQYLTRTDEVYRGDRAALFMVSPPIKAAADRDRLWEGLHEGVIQMVSTDHCPFTLAEKRNSRDFREIPTGLPGVETTLPLLLTEWQSRGWPIEQLADRLSTAAAKRFGLYPTKGSLRPGADADVVVYDTGPCRTLHAEELHMNVDWNPYEGDKVVGEVRHVLLRGEPLVEEGCWTNKPPSGRFVHRRQSADMSTGE